MKTKRATQAKEDLRISRLTAGVWCMSLVRSRHASTKVSGSLCQIVLQQICSVRDSGGSGVKLH